MKENSHSLFGICYIGRVSRLDEFFHDGLIYADLQKNNMFIRTSIKAMFSIVR